MNPSEVNIYIESIGGQHSNVKIDSVKFQKMVLLFNAIHDGWCIKKKEGSYYFTKNHEGKKEIISDAYLLTFMKEHFNINKLLV